MRTQRFNVCHKCGQPVPAPFRAHVENLGGCPEARHNRVTWLTNTGPFNKDVSDEELDGFMEALHALGFEPTITHINRKD